MWLKVGKWPYSITNFEFWIIGLVSCCRCWCICSLWGTYWWSIIQPRRGNCFYLSVEPRLWFCARNSGHCVYKILAIFCVYIVCVPECSAQLQCFATGAELSRPFSSSALISTAHFFTPNSSCIFTWVDFLAFSPIGQLLLSPQNTVAFIFCCFSGSIHSTLHQSVWEQPPGSILCGVSHPMASLWACALHSAGHIWWSVGSSVYPHQHCLVSEAEDNPVGQVSCCRGSCRDSHHCHPGFPQWVYPSEHKWAHLWAVQWLWPPGLLQTLWLWEPFQHKQGGWAARQTSWRGSLQCNVAAGLDTHTENCHHYIHLWHEGEEILLVLPGYLCVCRFSGPSQDTIKFS